MSEREEIACAACGEPILAVARKCKHCGEWVGERPVPVESVPAPSTSAARPTPDVPPMPAAPSNPAAVVVIVAAVAIGLLAFGLSISSSPVGQVSVSTMVRNGVGGVQGEVTDYTLVSRSERGDCRKVHAYFRVDGGSELEGTFLYLWNSDKGVAYRTYTAATIDRRGTAPSGWYSGEMNSDEQRICSEMIARSEGYSDGPYEVIR